MTSTQALAVMVVAAPLVTAGLVIVAPRKHLAVLAQTGAVATSALAVVLVSRAVKDAGHPLIGNWIVIDAAGALLLAVTAVVGLASVLMSPSYLRGAHS
ncbi:MAG TPA: hypothetical protein VFG00_10440, partial [Acidothermaceae bacterium]|nr:hypothetical protein [Acidothermaceae bacterium]